MKNQDITLTEKLGILAFLSAAVGLGVIMEYLHPTYTEKAPVEKRAPENPEQSTPIAIQPTPIKKPYQHILEDPLGEGQRYVRITEVKTNDDYNLGIYALVQEADSTKQEFDKYTRLVSKLGPIDNPASAESGLWPGLTW